MNEPHSTERRRTSRRSRGPAPEAPPAAGRWIEWGLASRALHAGTKSGDLHLVNDRRDGTLLAVVDGLGHGDDAAAAAALAIDIIQRNADEPITRLLQLCHVGLRGTRGVVLSLAAYARDPSRLTWLGVGNVEGVLLRAGAGGGRGRERLLLRGGVVGGRLPDLREETIPVSGGDLLVFVTDGVRAPFELPAGGGSAKELADRILERHGKSTDDALVLVARFLQEAR